MNLKVFILSKGILASFILFNLGTELLSSVPQDPLKECVAVLSQSNQIMHDQSLQEMIDNKECYSPEIQHTLTVLMDKFGNAPDLANRLMELKELELEYASIADVTPLAYLTLLESLTLDNNQISNVTPLASLKTLKCLSLSNNKIKDITPLSRLSQLTSLCLYGNDITIVAPLTTLTQLNELSIFRNHIKDIGPVAHLKNLHALECHENLIEDVQPLASLTNLEKISLNNNKIKDISALAQCAALEHLDLENNQITDVKGLNKLKHLRTLLLSHNELQDITPLAKLTSLERLYLDGNKIQDVAPLAKLSNLQTLYLNDNQITNGAPLAKLKNLEYLYLKNNRITKCKALMGFEHILELNLEGNPIEDVCNLEKIKSRSGRNCGTYARNLQESRHVSSSEGKAAFDRQIGGISNIHLGESLPPGITYDELSQLVFGEQAQEKRTSGSLMYDALAAFKWPGRSDVYVGIGSIKDDHLTIYCTAFIIKKPHDFEVVARSPKGLNFLEEVTQGKKGSHKVIMEDQFDELVRFDHAVFQIAPKEFAFGVRFAQNHGFSGGFDHWQNLVLFVQKDKTIVPILNHPIYSLTNSAGSWNADGTREHFVKEEEWALSFMRRRYNGHFEVQIKPMQKDKRTISRLRWENGEYVLFS